MLPATLPAALAPADRQAFDTLFADGLFDPAAEPRPRFVRFTYHLRTVWTGDQPLDLVGWLLPGRDGLPAGALLPDGQCVPCPVKARAIDFVADCRGIITTTLFRRMWAAARPAAPPAKGADPDFAAFTERNLPKFEPAHAPNILRAAWLHRLGEDALAARMLALADVTSLPEPGELEVPRKLGPAHDFLAAVHAYMVRADDEALFYANRLVTLYLDAPPPKREPAPAPARAARGAAGDKDDLAPFQQGRELLAELRRRRAEGTFGKEPAARPADFEAWPVERRVAWLTRALEDVDARQDSQPGGISLGSDWRVKALIDLGDPAVPALLDCLEKDPRLTRSVHFWRDFSDARTVLSVREAALVAVMSILRVRVFEPASTGDNFTARGPAGAAEAVKTLRAYWASNGTVPFEQRMMNVLRDPHSRPEALREAAENLSTADRPRVIDSTAFAIDFAEVAAKKPNPALARFQNPTAAEAILAAMGRDLAALDAAPAAEESETEGDEGERSKAEARYVNALIELGDRRIAPELARRCAAAPRPSLRRRFAFACHALGDDGPIIRFAEDFKAGKIGLPRDAVPRKNADRRAENVELRGIVEALVAARLPATDAALDALADEHHPLYPFAVAGVRAGDGPWFGHPFCLTILRRDLDRKEADGWVYRIKGDRLIRQDENSTGNLVIPAPLTDPAARREQAEGRACDAAAMKLNGLVIGLPGYHPLFKDADARLEAMRKVLDHYRGHYRPATAGECEAMRLYPWKGPIFLPDLRPLGRPATAADVEAGRAIFHLGGRGEVPNLKLPATALWKRDLAAIQKAREARQGGGGLFGSATRRVLVVQAERAANGKVRFGIIDRNEMRAADEEELAEIAPLEEPKARK